MRSSGLISRLHLALLRLSVLRESGTINCLASMHATACHYCPFPSNALSQASSLSHRSPCGAFLPSRTWGPSTAWLSCTRGLSITAPSPAVRSLKPRLSPALCYAARCCYPGARGDQLPGGHKENGEVHGKGDCPPLAKQFLASTMHFVIHKAGSLLR